MENKEKAKSATIQALKAELEAAKAPEADPLQEAQAISQEQEKADEAAARMGAPIPDELAVSVGRSVIELMMAETGLDADMIAEMLLGGDPNKAGLAAISAKAAKELAALEAEGKLERKAEDYIADSAFVSLLREMPLPAAVRIYDAEQKAQTAPASQETLQNAERGIIEKLLARKALPQPIKSGVAASPELDYSHMSSAQFSELKKRLMRAAGEGRKIRI